jgi:hypothetical protein
MLQNNLQSIYYSSSASNSRIPHSFMVQWTNLCYDNMRDHESCSTICVKLL